MHKCRICGKKLAYRDTVHLRAHEKTAQKADRLFQAGTDGRTKGRMRYPERQGIGRSPEKHRGQGRRDRADQ